MRIKRLDFEGLCQVIRELCVLDPKERITAETQFERDLGISGDDGWLILDEAEKAFGIRFSPKSFQLRPKEALFHSEVENPFALIVGMIRREPEVEVRPFTVGELYQAILKEREKSRRSD